MRDEEWTTNPVSIVIETQLLIGKGKVVHRIQCIVLEIVVCGAVKLICPCARGH